MRPVLEICALRCVSARAGLRLSNVPLQPLQNLVWAHEGQFVLVQLFAIEEDSPEPSDSLDLPRRFRLTPVQRDEHVR